MRDKRFGLGRRLQVPQWVVVQGKLGRTQARHRQLRQHHLRHADRLPVHHHGGLDHHTLLRQYTVVPVLSALPANLPVTKHVHVMQ